MRGGVAWCVQINAGWVWLGVYQVSAGWCGQHTFYIFGYFIKQVLIGPCAAHVGVCPFLVLRVWILLGIGIRPEPCTWDGIGNSLDSGVCNQSERKCLKCSLGKTESDKMEMKC